MACSGVIARPSPSSTKKRSLSVRRRLDLYAEILSETPGALWTREGIEQHRISQAPSLTRIVVAIDPSVSSALEAAETGIIVAGVGENGHGYVLEDSSCRASPDRSASRAVMAYHKHRADRILGEVNNGGEMVEHVIRTVDPAVPFRRSTHHGERSHEQSRSPLSTSKARFTTSAVSPNSKTKCACTFQGNRPPTGWMPWCGRSRT